MYLPKIRIVFVVLYHANCKFLPFRHKRTLLQSQFNYISSFNSMFYIASYPSSNMATLQPNLTQKHQDV